MKLTAVYMGRNGTSHTIQTALFRLSDHKSREQIKPQIPPKSIMLYELWGIFFLKYLPTETTQSQKTGSLWMLHISLLKFSAQPKEYLRVLLAKKFQLNFSAITNVSDNTDKLLGKIKINASIILNLRNTKRKDQIH